MYKFKDSQLPVYPTNIFDYNYVMLFTHMPYKNEELNWNIQKHKEMFLKTSSYIFIEMPIK